MKKQTVSMLAAAVIFAGTAPVLLAELKIANPPAVDKPSTGKAAADDPAAVVEDGGQYDTIQFMGKDLLSGKVISYYPDKVLTWTHPDAEKPIEFKVANLKELTLSGKKLPAPAGTSTVRLTNGDIFKGTVQKLDKDNLMISTWYAGDLKLSRKMLKEILPSCASTALYEGPNDVKEWTMDNQSGRGDKRKVTVSNKTLLIPNNCNVGRDMKLPDMVKIEFEMGTGQNSNMNLFLFSDQLTRHQGNSYILNISSGYLYLQRYSRNEGSDSLGQGECRKMMEKSMAKFTILVDKKKKAFTIMVNGGIVQQVTDNRGDFCGKGGFVTFYNSGGFGMLKLRNISVSKWDGRIPSASSPDSEENAKDNIVFSNEDKVTGKLKSIENGQITFETEFASLNVPIERARSIRFSSEGAQVAKRNANDIRLFFNTEDSITIDAQKLADGKISGKSENFGSGEFLLNAFKKIAFNIYAEPAEEGKDSPEIAVDAGIDE